MPVAYFHIGTHVLYGKVDQVPGLFFVATRFFDVQFIPLVPLESFLVFEEVEGRKLKPGGEQGQLHLPPLPTGMPAARLVRLPGFFGDHWGASIGLVGKSVRYAWLRLALFAATLVPLIWAAVVGVRCWNAQALGRQASENAWDMIPLLVGSFFMFLTLLSSYRLSRATPDRAMELASLVGLPVEVVSASLSGS
jgi:hypothetical protein